MKPIQTLVSYDKDRVSNGYYDKANGYYDPAKTHLNFDKADKYAFYALIGLIVCAVIVAVAV